MQTGTPYQARSPIQASQPNLVAQPQAATVAISNRNAQVAKAAGVQHGASVVRNQGNGRSGAGAAHQAGAQKRFRNDAGRGHNGSVSRGWSFGDPLPQGLVDAAAGFGDGVFFGIPNVVRDVMGINGVVNKNSWSYRRAQVAGNIHLGVLGGGLVLKVLITQVGL